VLDEVSTAILGDAVAENRGAQKPKPPVITGNKP
jgi:hypothetical protein